jgi:hypothetical protein
MSNRKCSIEEFDSALDDIFTGYTDEVTANEKKAVDVAAKEVNQTIKDHISFKQHTGDYVNAFRLATTDEDSFHKEKTWYVAAPQYRLTHLLENGHALPQGGRTKAYPHIKYGEEIAEKRMIELSKEAVERAGG